MTRFLRATFAIGLFVLSVSASTAYAGFQWTAPSAGIASPQTVPAAPVPPVMSENLSGSMDANAAPIPTTPDGPARAAPVYGNGMTDDPITWNATHSAGRHAPAATMPRAPQNGFQPSQPQSQSMQPTNLYALENGQSAGYSSYAVADGFGRDLPLVMAIRQIVPSQFGFVFDDGIDLNSRVSWRGGRPWDVVLQETLSPLGLGASVRGNVVSITRSAGGMMQSTSAGQAMGGPVVMTDNISNSTMMPMTATPVAMVATPPDDMMVGGYAGSPATTSASLASNTNWTAPRNSTLRTILEDWSDRVGVELYWASEYDYPIQSAVNIQGTFEEAVQTLLKGLSQSRPRPLGRLHPNLPEGPAVLVIETRQNSM
ncbi:MAG: hypothetical protein EBQ96_07195 [Proteobacteria bacterium]|nr:hypothetical protein [Pseudomonadota bacterium]